MNRALLLVGALVMVFTVGTARAVDGPVDYLGGMKTALMTRDAELVGELDKTGKKTKKKIGAALKKIDKLAPDADFQGVVKTAGQVAGALKKYLATEAALSNALNDVVGMLEMTVGDKLADFKGQIDDLVPGKEQDKARKKHDQADATFTKAKGQTDPKKKLNGFRSTDKKFNAVEKAIAKGEPGGGGGAECDEGRAIGQTENFAAMISGAAYVPQNIETTVVRDQMSNEITSVTVSFYRCTGDKKSVFELTFPEVPRVGRYTLGLFQGQGSLFYADDLPGFGKVIFGGDSFIEVTGYDAATGRLQAMFQAPDDADFPITNGNIDVVIDIQ